MSPVDLSVSALHLLSVRQLWGIKRLQSDPKNYQKESSKSDGNLQVNARPLRSLT